MELLDGLHWEREDHDHVPQVLATSSSQGKDVREEPAGRGSHTYSSHPASIPASAIRQSVEKRRQSAPV